MEKFVEIKTRAGEVLGEIAESELRDLGDVNELMFDVYVQTRLNWLDKSRCKNHLEAKRYVYAWDSMMKGEIDWETFERVADEIDAEREARVARGE